MIMGSWLKGYGGPLMANGIENSALLDCGNLEEPTYNFLRIFFAIFEDTLTIWTNSKSGSYIGAEWLSFKTFYHL